ncbi:MAG TPA: hypothetical protein PK766_00475, partial [Bacteroidales bacterium]|nr:hypothetical protein [Bacteroidales bacterium]
MRKYEERRRISEGGFRKADFGRWISEGGFRKVDFGRWISEIRDKGTGQNKFIRYEEAYIYFIGCRTDTYGIV